MSLLVFKPVETRREKKQFLELPWELYRGDQNWVPPLRTNQAELVGYKKHPFYDHAEGQTFLAVRDGKPCGRVLALINHVHNERFQERRGMFGFFESVDDQEVATGLFDAAKAWFAERDVFLMRGPINPSLNYECGLLIDGFYEPPTFMMTYNHRYYAELIEGYGFRKSQDLYAFIGELEMLAGVDKKLKFVIDEATRRFGVKMRRLNKKKFRDEVRMFLHIYNESLGGTWGFTPLSAAEIEHLSAGMQHLIVPEMTAVAEVDGRPVASAFGLLDYNPIIKKIDGRLFPFGFLRLMWDRKKIHRVRLISTNVLPEFQRWGLGLVVLHRLLPDGLEWGMTECEYSWVLESNDLSYKTLKRGGAKLTKTYRIYDYDPATPAL